jgi:hypothetical protein
VRLEPGINVLVLKVVRLEKTETWGFCARLVDDAGRPAEGLRVRLTP